MVRTALVVVLLMLLEAFTTSASQAQSLSERIEGLIREHPGSVCVAIKHLGTGETYLHRENEVVPTASLIKFPVLVEYYRQIEAGLIDHQATVTLRDEDKVPGSGY
jgi:beta-lactamase class A